MYNERHGALAQQLLQRIVELEDENRALRGDLVTLSSSYTAAMSKNNLFQAKILELQARIDVGQNPASTAIAATPRYRSPFVPTERGGVTYRFERSSKPERPMSARVKPVQHHRSGAVTARDHTSTRPGGVSKLLIEANDGSVYPVTPPLAVDCACVHSHVYAIHLSVLSTRNVTYTIPVNTRTHAQLQGRKSGGKFLHVATASSNPRSVDRIFRELRRRQVLLMCELLCRKAR